MNREANSQLMNRRLIHENLKVSDIAKSVDRFEDAKLKDSPEEKAALDAIAAILDLGDLDPRKSLKDNREIQIDKLTAAIENGQIDKDIAVKLTLFLESEVHQEMLIAALDIEERYLVEASLETEKTGQSLVALRSSFKQQELIKEGYESWSQSADVSTWFNENLYRDLPKKVSALIDQIEDSEIQEASREALEIYLLNDAAEHMAYSLIWANVDKQGGFPSEDTAYTEFQTLIQKQGFESKPEDETAIKEIFSEAYETALAKAEVESPNARTETIEQLAGDNLLAFNLIEDLKTPKVKVGDPVAGDAEIGNVGEYEFSDGNKIVISHAFKGTKDNGKWIDGYWIKVYYKAQPNQDHLLNEKWGGISMDPLNAISKEGFKSSDSTVRKALAAAQAGPKTQVTTRQARTDENLSRLRDADPIAKVIASEVTPNNVILSDNEGSSIPSETLNPQDSSPTAQNERTETTDHISQIQPWLTYHGTLDNTPNNVIPDSDKESKSEKPPVQISLKYKEVLNHTDDQVQSYLSQANLEQISWTNFWNSVEGKPKNIPDKFMVVFRDKFISLAWPKLMEAGQITSLEKAADIVGVKSMNAAQAKAIKASTSLQGLIATDLVSLARSGKFNTSNTIPEGCPAWITKLVSNRGDLESSQAQYSIWAAYCNARYDELIFSQGKANIKQSDFKLEAGAEPNFTPKANLESLNQKYPDGLSLGNIAQELYKNWESKSHKSKEFYITGEINGEAVNLIARTVHYKDGTNQIYFNWGEHGNQELVVSFGPDESAETSWAKIQSELKKHNLNINKDTENWNITMYQEVFNNTNEYIDTPLGDEIASYISDLAINNRAAFLEVLSNSAGGASAALDPDIVYRKSAILVNQSLEHDFAASQNLSGGNPIIEFNDIDDQATNIQVVCIDSNGHERIFIAEALQKTETYRDGLKKKEREVQINQTAVELAGLAAGRYKVIAIADFEDGKKDCIFTDIIEIEGNAETISEEYRPEIAIENGQMLVKNFNKNFNIADFEITDAEGTQVLEGLGNLVSDPINLTGKYLSEGVYRLAVTCHDDMNSQSTGTTEITISIDKDLNVSQITDDTALTIYTKPAEEVTAKSRNQGHQNYLPNASGPRVTQEYQAVNLETTSQDTERTVEIINSNEIITDADNRVFDQLRERLLARLSGSDLENVQAAITTGKNWGKFCEAPYLHTETASTANVDSRIPILKGIPVNAKLDPEAEGNKKLRTAYQKVEEDIADQSNSVSPSPKAQTDTVKSAPVEQDSSLEAQNNTTTPAQPIPSIPQFSETAETPELNLTDSLVSGITFSYKVANLKVGEAAQIKYKNEQDKDVYLIIRSWAKGKYAIKQYPSDPGYTDGDLPTGDTFTIQSTAPVLDLINDPRLFGITRFPLANEANCETLAAKILGSKFSAHVSIESPAGSLSLTFNHKEKSYELKDADGQQLFKLTSPKQNELKDKLIKHSQIQVAEDQTPSAQPQAIPETPTANLPSVHFGSESVILSENKGSSIPNETLNPEDSSPEAQNDTLTEYLTPSSTPASFEDGLQFMTNLRNLKEGTLGPHTYKTASGEIRYAYFQALDKGNIRMVSTNTAPQHQVGQDLPAKFEGDTVDKTFAANTVINGMTNPSWEKFNGLVRYGSPLNLDNLNQFAQDISQASAGKDQLIVFEANGETYKLEAKAGRSRVLSKDNKEIAKASNAEELERTLKLTLFREALPQPRTFAVKLDRNLNNLNELQTALVALKDPNRTTVEITYTNHAGTEQGIRFTKPYGENQRVELVQLNSNGGVIKKKSFETRQEAVTAALTQGLGVLRIDTGANRETEPDIVISKLNSLLNLATQAGDGTFILEITSGSEALTAKQNQFSIYFDGSKYKLYQGHIKPGVPFDKKSNIDEANIRDLKPTLINNLYPPTIEEKAATVSLGDNGEAITAYSNTNSSSLTAALVKQFGNEKNPKKKEILAQACEASYQIEKDMVVPKDEKAAQTAYAQLDWNGFKGAHSADLVTASAAQTDYAKELENKFYEYTLAVYLAQGTEVLAANANTSYPDSASFLEASRHELSKKIPGITSEQLASNQDLANIYGEIAGQELTEGAELSSELVTDVSPYLDGADTRLRLWIDANANNKTPLWTQLCLDNSYHQPKAETANLEYVLGEKGQAMRRQLDRHSEGNFGLLAQLVEIQLKKSSSIDDLVKAIESVIGEDTQLQQAIASSPRFAKLREQIISQTEALILKIDFKKPFQNELNKIRPYISSEEFEALQARIIKTRIIGLHQDRISSSHKIYLDAKLQWIDINYGINGALARNIDPTADDNLDTYLKYQALFMEVQSQIELGTLDDLKSQNRDLALLTKVYGTDPEALASYRNADSYFTKSVLAVKQTNNSYSYYDPETGQEVSEPSDTPPSLEAEVETITGETFGNQLEGALGRMRRWDKAPYDRELHASKFIIRQAKNSEKIQVEFEGEEKEFTGSNAAQQATDHMGRLGGPILEESFNPENSNGLKELGKTLAAHSSYLNTFTALLNRPDGNIYTLAKTNNGWMLMAGEQAYPDSNSGWTAIDTDRSARPKLESYSNLLGVGFDAYQTKQEVAEAEDKIRTYLNLNKDAEITDLTAVNEALLTEAESYLEGHPDQVASWDSVAEAIEAIYDHNDGYNALATLRQASDSRVTYLPKLDGQLKEMIAEKRARIHYENLDTVSLLEGTDFTYASFQTKAKYADSNWTVEGGQLDEIAQSKYKQYLEGFGIDIKVDLSLEPIMISDSTAYGDYIATTIKANPDLSYDALRLCIGSSQGEQVKPSDALQSAFAQALVEVKPPRDSQELTAILEQAGIESIDDFPEIQAQATEIMSNSFDSKQLVGLTWTDAQNQFSEVTGLAQEYLNNWLEANLDNLRELKLDGHIDDPEAKRAALANKIIDLSQDSNQDLAGFPEDQVTSALKNFDSNRLEDKQFENKLYISDAMTKRGIAQVEGADEISQAVTENCQLFFQPKIITMYQQTPEGLQTEYDIQAPVVLRTSLEDGVLTTQLHAQGQSAQFTFSKGEGLSVNGLSWNINADLYTQALVRALKEMNIHLATSKAEAIKRVDTRQFIAAAGIPSISPESSDSELDHETNNWIANHKSSLAYSVYRTPEQNGLVLLETEQEGEPEDGQIRITPAQLRQVAEILVTAEKNIELGIYDVSSQYRQLITMGLSDLAQKLSERANEQKEKLKHQNEDLRNRTASWITEQLNVQEEFNNKDSLEHLLNKEKSSDADIKYEYYFNARINLGNGLGDTPGLLAKAVGVESSSADLGKLIQDQFNESITNTIFLMLRDEMGADSFANYLIMMAIRNQAIYERAEENSNKWEACDGVTVNVSTNKYFFIDGPRLINTITNMSAEELNQSTNEFFAEQEKKDYAELIAGAQRVTKDFMTSMEEAGDTYEDAESLDTRVETTKHQEYIEEMLQLNQDNPDNVSQIRETMNGMTTEVADLFYALGGPNPQSLDVLRNWANLEEMSFGDEIHRHKIDMFNSFAELFTAMTLGRSTSLEFSDMTESVYGISEEKFFSRLENLYKLKNFKNHENKGEIKAVLDAIGIPYENNLIDKPLPWSAAYTDLLNEYEKFLIDTFELMESFQALEENRTISQTQFIIEQVQARPEEKDWNNWTEADLKSFGLYSLNNPYRRSQQEALTPSEKDAELTLIWQVIFTKNPELQQSKYKSPRNLAVYFHELRVDINKFDQIEKYATELGYSKNPTAIAKRQEQLTKALRETLKKVYEDKLTETRTQLEAEVSSGKLHSSALDIFDNTKLSYEQYLLKERSRVVLGWRSERDARVDSKLEGLETLTGDSSIFGPFDLLDTKQFESVDINNNLDPARKIAISQQAIDEFLDRVIGKESNANDNQENREINRRRRYFAKNPQRILALLYFYNKNLDQSNQSMFKRAIPSTEQLSRVSGLNADILFSQGFFSESYLVLDNIDQNLADSINSQLFQDNEFGRLRAGQEIASKAVINTGSLEGLDAVHSQNQELQNAYDFLEFALDMSADLPNAHRRRNRDHKISFIEGLISLREDFRKSDGQMTEDLMAAAEELGIEVELEEAMDSVDSGRVIYERLRAKTATAKQDSYELEILYEETLTYLEEGVRYLYNINQRLEADRKGLLNFSQIPRSFRMEVKKQMEDMSKILLLLSENLSEDGSEIYEMHISDFMDPAYKLTEPQAAKADRLMADIVAGQPVRAYFKTTDIQNFLERSAFLNNESQIDTMSQILRRGAHLAQRSEMREQMNLAVERAFPATISIKLDHISEIKQARGLEKLSPEDRYRIGQELEYWETQGIVPFNSDEYRTQLETALDPQGQAKLEQIAKSFDQIKLLLENPEEQFNITNPDHKQRFEQLLNDNNVAEVLAVFGAEFNLKDADKFKAEALIKAYTEFSEAESEKEQNRVLAANPEFALFIGLIKANDFYAALALHFNENCETESSRIQFMGGLSSLFNMTLDADGKMQLMELMKFGFKSPQIPIGDNLFLGIEGAYSPNNTFTRIAAVLRYERLDTDTQIRAVAKAGATWDVLNGELAAYLSGDVGFRHRSGFGIQLGGSIKSDVLDGDLTIFEKSVHGEVLTPWLNIEGAYAGKANWELGVSALNYPEKAEMVWTQLHPSQRAERIFKKRQEIADREQAALRIWNGKPAQSLHEIAETYPDADKTSMIARWNYLAIEQNPEAGQELLAIWNQDNPNSKFTNLGTLLSTYYGLEDQSNVRITRQFSRELNKVESELMIFNPNKKENFAEIIKITEQADKKAERLAFAEMAEDLDKIEADLTRNFTRSITASIQGHPDSSMRQNFTADKIEGLAEDLAESFMQDLDQMQRDDILLLLKPEGLRRITSGLGITVGLDNGIPFVGIKFEFGRRVFKKICIPSPARLKELGLDILETEFARAGLSEDLVISSELDLFAEQSLSNLNIDNPTFARYGTFSNAVRVSREGLNPTGHTFYDGSQSVQAAYDAALKQSEKTPETIHGYYLEEINSRTNTSIRFQEIPSQAEVFKCKIDLSRIAGDFEIHYDPNPLYEGFFDITKPEMTLPPGLIPVPFEFRIKSPAGVRTVIYIGFTYVKDIDEDGNAVLAAVKSPAEMENEEHWYFRGENNHALNTLSYKRVRTGYSQTRAERLGTLTEEPETIDLNRLESEAKRKGEKVRTEYQEFLSYELEVSAELNKANLVDALAAYDFTPLFDSLGLPTELDKQAPITLEIAQLYIELTRDYTAYINTERQAAFVKYSKQMQELTLLRSFARLSGENNNYDFTLTVSPVDLTAINVVLGNFSPSPFTINNRKIHVTDKGGMLAACNALQGIYESSFQANIKQNTGFNKEYFLNWLGKKQNGSYANSETYLNQIIERSLSPLHAIAFRKLIDKETKEDQNIYETLSPAKRTYVDKIQAALSANLGISSDAGNILPGTGLDFIATQFTTRTYEITIVELLPDLSEELKVKGYKSGENLMDWLDRSLANLPSLERATMRLLKSSLQKQFGKTETQINVNPEFKKLNQSEQEFILDIALGRRARLSQTEINYLLSIGRLETYYPVSLSFPFPIENGDKARLKINGRSRFEQFTDHIREGGSGFTMLETIIFDQTGDREQAKRIAQSVTEPIITQLEEDQKSFETFWTNPDKEEERKQFETLWLDFQAELKKQGNNQLAETCLQKSLAIEDFLKDEVGIKMTIDPTKVSNPDSYFLTAVRGGRIDVKLGEEPLFASLLIWTQEIGASDDIRTKALNPGDLDILQTAIHRAFQPLPERNNAYAYGPKETQDSLPEQLDSKKEITSYAKALFTCPSGVVASRKLAMFFPKSQAFALREIRDIFSKPGRSLEDTDKAIEAWNSRLDSEGEKASIVKQLQEFHQVLLVLDKIILVSNQASSKAGDKANPKFWIDAFRGIEGFDKVAEGYQLTIHENVHVLGENSVPLVLEIEKDGHSFYLAPDMLTGEVTWSFFKVCINQMTSFNYRMQAFTRLGGAGELVAAIPNTSRIFGDQLGFSVDLGGDTHESSYAVAKEAELRAGLKKDIEDENPIIDQSAEDDCNDTGTKDPQSGETTGGSTGGDGVDLDDDEEEDEEDSGNQIPGHQHG